MSQISPPMRIVLIVAVVFAAAYFAFMRPGATEEAPAPATAPAAAAGAPAPATSAPGQTVETAQEAAGAAGAAAAARAGEASAPATAAQAGATAPAPPAAEPATKADVAKAGLPAAVAKAVAAKDVVVLYFWNPKAADDRAVRAELREVDRHKGKVEVHVANLKDIARFAPITRGVSVEQSPSVVVVDPKRRGTLLEGYVDTVTIEQAVSDALRAG